MKSKFVEQEICYTGSELCPHWIYKNFNIQGDAMVCFIGECEVKLTEMVDIADVISNSPIYSKKMVHFIAEHFNMPLLEGVARQRLLIAIAKDVINSKLFGIDTENGKINCAEPLLNTVIRKGDDLFFNFGKLSVSIAGKSINSVLIHLGINIDSDGTPVKAAGLQSDLKFEYSKIKEISQQIMLNYCKEHQEIIDASCKVKGIV